MQVIFSTRGMTVSRTCQELLAGPPPPDPSVSGA